MVDQDDECLKTLLEVIFMLTWDRPICERRPLGGQHALAKEYGPDLEC